MFQINFQTVYVHTGEDTRLQFLNYKLKEDWAATISQWVRNFHCLCLLIIMQFRMLTATLLILCCWRDKEYRHKYDFVSRFVNEATENIASFTLKIILNCWRFNALQPTCTTNAQIIKEKKTVLLMDFNIKNTRKLLLSCALQLLTIRWRCLHSCYNVTIAWRRTLPFICVFRTVCIQSVSINVVLYLLGGKKRTQSTEQ